MHLFLLFRVEPFCSTSNKIKTKDRNCFLFVLLAFLFILCSGETFAQENSLIEAQKCFKQFVDLEHAYDIALLDLYAPTASIKDIRIYQDGETKPLIWSSSDYKQILKAALPLAKARNDSNSYSQVSYQKEGNSVRVRCQRYSVLKKTTAPFELLLSPINKNNWRIVEEILNSQP